MRNVIGLFWVFAGAVFAVFALACWIFTGSAGGFGLSALLAAVLGFALYRSARTPVEPMGVEALVATALIWISLPLIGMMPYLAAGLSPIDAIFEAVSGLTTTGATILTDFEALSPVHFVYRGFTQWVGGIGVTVLFIAVLPQLAVAGRQLFFTETTGVQKEKLTPKVRQTANGVLRVYLLWTAVAFLGYMAGGIGIYEALANALATVPAGGFSPNPQSFASYSYLTQWIACLVMFFAGVNFMLQYRAVRERKSDFLLMDPEFRAYAVLILGFGVAMALWLALNQGQGMIPALTHGFFQTISIMTGTGFASADFAQWAIPVQIVLLGLMLIGGSAGSAGGGVKVVRWILVIKHIGRELKRALHPHAVLNLRYGTRTVGEDVLRSVFAFLGLYVVILGAGILLISVFEQDFVVAISSAMACLGNVGPGLGAVGPMGSFGDLSVVSKATLTFLMWAGRLELIPVFLLFYPETWRSLR